MSAPPREDPEWYTPGDLPAAVTGYDVSPQDTLPVGAAGKVGVLDLGLARRGGVTRVWRHYQRVPLHVYRPIYLDEGRPDMAFIFVQQHGDGLVQGDRQRIDIECGEGSATHVTTQAATNIFTARQNYATQLVNLRVDQGAVLEYLPDPVVPFRGARLFARTCVTVDPGATVILGETLLPGRVAHHEAHVYDLYWAEMTVQRSDGRLLFADVLRVHPGVGQGSRSLGVLGQHDVIAALYVISGECRPARLVELLRQSLAECGEVVSGVGELPNGAGAVVKLLGASRKDVQRAMNTAWSAARLVLVGAPAPNRRKG